MARITLAVVIMGALGLIVTGCALFGGQDQPVDFWQPTVSPDGTLIAYIARGAQGYDLFLLDVRSGQERLLLALERDIVYPNWSPDGKHLSFMYIQDKDNWDIFTVDIEVRTMFRVTSDPAADVNPSWTPTGQIVFNSDRGGRWGIYLINPDGTGLQRVSFDRPPKE